MNFQFLKYFFDATKYTSFKKAAELNHITPGAVSQGILRLEEELAIKLFHHRKNSFELTDQGRILFENSQSIFGAIDNVKNKISESTSPFAGNINFGTQQSIASSFLPSILKSFKNKYPLINVNFTLGHTTHIKQLLDRGEIDFAFSIDNLDYGRHSKITLFKGNFVYISKSKLNPVKDILEFLLTGETEETRKLQKYFLENNNSPLPVKMKIDSWGVIKSMALEGHGIGFIPDYLLSKSEEKFRITNKLFPKIQYQICCIIREGHLLNSKSQKLIEFVQRATAK